MSAKHNRWIVSTHHFREHRTIQSALAEQERLKALLPKKVFHLYRIKTAVDDRMSSCESDNHAARYELTDGMKRLFGADAMALAMLLHCAIRLNGFKDGKFKTGWECAIEEAAAFLDSEHGDDGAQMQTLMQQVCGLMDGLYALTEIRGPVGIVQPETELAAASS